MDLTADILEELFSALGAHLEVASLSISIVVVGGASLAAGKLIDRTTKDVDVIAKAERIDGNLILSKASPVPIEFTSAVERVSRDYGLPKDWLNTVIDSQWEFGLPPGIEEDITWKTYSTLTVGFVGRKGLIPLKLFASVDQGPRSKHWQDLINLAPTDVELSQAATWVKTQDDGAHFKQDVEQASEQLRRALGRSGN
jgi:hypothetical protein